MHSNRQEDLGYNKQDVINAFKQVGRPWLQHAGCNQCIQTGRKDLGYNKQDVINAFKQVGRSQLQQTGCNQCIQIGRKISVTTNRM